MSTTDETTPDETEPTEEFLDPQEFVLDDWINGAEPTERSCTVYAAGKLAARKDELEEEIRKQDRAGLRTLGGNSTDGLRKEWKDVSEKIVASKLTVRCRAMSKTRMREIAAEYRKAHKIKLEWSLSRDPNVLEKWDYEGQENACVRASMVHPVIRDGEQFARFVDAIGPAQWDLIVETYRKAVQDSPAVGPDFSPVSSGSDDGQAS
jgi:hypothetical protein